MKKKRCKKKYGACLNPEYCHRKNKKTKKKKKRDKEKKKKVPGQLF